jgi:hypothetical protein
MLDYDANRARPCTAAIASPCTSPGHDIPKGQPTRDRQVPAPTAPFRP